MKKAVLVLSVIIVLIVNISLIFWYMFTYKRTLKTMPIFNFNNIYIPSSVSSNVTNKKLFGVNIAGAEFSNNLPGVQNKDYIYPSSLNGYKGFSYFAKKGLFLVRIPFLWERLAGASEATLSAKDLFDLKAMVIDAKNNKQQVILDMHNYARHYRSPLTRQDSASFSKFWSLIANEFKDDSAIFGYELMNEPHDLNGGCSAWRDLAQAGIDGIRKVDREHTIIVPGYSWQSAYFWKSKSGCLISLKDNESKIVFSAHQYFDSNFSGQTYKSSACLKTDYSAGLVQPFLSWLKANNVKGIFTEYGVNNNSCWLSNLDSFLSIVSKDPSIIGGTYWAAGPWWGNYALSVEPSGASGDKPQVAILGKYAGY